jgi:hypothetical protein
MAKAVLIMMMPKRMRRMAGMRGNVVIA